MIYEKYNKNIIRINGDVANGVGTLFVNDCMIKVESEIVNWEKNFNIKIDYVEQQIGNFSTVSEQIIVHLVDNSLIVYSTSGSLLYTNYNKKIYFDNYNEEFKAKILYSKELMPQCYKIKVNVIANERYELFDINGMCVYEGEDTTIEFYTKVFEDHLFQIKTRDQIELRDVVIVKVKEQSCIYIIGDSTLTNQELPYWSWPQLLQARSKEICINYAICARSTKSFIEEGRLDKVFSQIKPGDKLIVGFGHNDQKPTYFGIGVNEFVSNIKLIIDMCIKQSVLPIIVTPIARRNFVGNELHETLEPYLSALKGNFDSYLIDNNKFTKQMISELGVEGSKQVFVHSDLMKIYDNTHTSYYGADKICDYFIKQYNISNK